MKARLPSHLATNERDAIQAYIARIRRQFPDSVLAVILFGSKARGCAASDEMREESDIDLFVLMDEENEAICSELWGIASDISLAYDVLLSVRVYGRERWAESERIRLPLYRAIVGEGIALMSNRTAA